jgi:hypothetical protein
MRESVAILSILRRRTSKTAVFSFHNLFHSPENLNSAQTGGQILRKPWKMKRFDGVTPEITPPAATATLNRARTTQKPHGKIENRVQQFEYAVNGDAHQTKRQRQKPHEGIEHQGDQRQWPAQDKQNAPQKESNHGDHLTGCYVTATREVPSVT